MLGDKTQKAHAKHVTWAFFTEALKRFWLFKMKKYKVQMFNRILLFKCSTNALTLPSQYERRVAYQTILFINLSNSPLSNKTGPCPKQRIFGFKS
jgi:hypothetical protein